MKTRLLRTGAYDIVGGRSRGEAKDSALLSSRDAGRIHLQFRRHRFNPWIRKIPWRRAWQPTPVLLPGESHGHRSLAGYSPWGHRESDTTDFIRTCAPPALPLSSQRPVEARRAKGPAWRWREASRRSLGNHVGSFGPQKIPGPGRLERGDAGRSWRVLRYRRRARPGGLPGGGGGNPMNHSTPGLPVHHQLLEFTQTHVHRVSDAIQPSHPLSSPSPPAPNPSQHHPGR